MSTRRALTVLTITALSVAPLMAGSASAADECTPTLSPTSVTVGTRPETATVVVTGCATAYYTVTSLSADGPVIRADIEHPDKVLTPVVDLRNVHAGAEPVRVVAYDADYVEVADFQSSISFRRATRWDNFDAGPEPVRRGAAIRIVGDLVRGDWDTGQVAGYKRTVTVQRKIGTGAWVPVRTVDLTIRGHLSTTVTATQQTASFRVVFTGNSVSAPATSGADEVAVR